MANSEGESKPPVSFEVDTLPPTVTITKGPAAHSSNTTSAHFEGEASEETNVTVHIKLEGSEVASATTTAAANKWSTSTLSKPLPTGNHTFTAYATEESGIGNGEGESKPPIEFEVDTLPPTVTITKGPAAHSSNTTSAHFEGEASEETNVTVHIKLEGSEVASATTTAAANKWSTSTLSKPLPTGNHTFTAYATEESGIGNGEGESKPPIEFEVDTLPPTVTITKGPAAHSSNTTSAHFEGEASEETNVTVHIKLEGSEVASATTTAAAGKWSTSTLSKPLPTGKHTFTAYATEESGVGNGEGESKPPVSFEVNTLAPKVTITEGPEPRSNNNTSPHFAGEASEDTKVTVHIKLEGSE